MLTNALNNSAIHNSSFKEN